MNASLPSAAQKNRLGRGLASLIGDNVPVNGRILPNQGEQRMVLIDKVKPSAFNPRKTFDATELDELAASIRERGLVQPLVVRPIGPMGAEYEIVAGERRWRAAQKAGMHLIPVIVRALTDQESLEIAIIENVQRADLNAIEEATGYRELISRFGYKQEELADIIGKSRSHLANTMRLLKLPDSVQKLVRNGDLSAGHARALVGREDAETVAREIVKDGLNVRDVEALFQAKKPSASNGGSGGNSAPITKDADTRAVEREMCDALGLAVTILPGANNTGEIIIRYKTLDQFEAVRGRLIASR
ncbi:MAG: ParB/RepB/Spo0J family partition protein [Hyphomicrobiales bacterium]|nr:ParB/RepB/Spo0J family partition protein [Hyphomicrobiales bacterium]